MVPLVSLALAVMVRFEPAVMLLLLAGLVIEMAGKALTVTVTGLDVVETPLTSVALAVNV